MENGKVVPNFLMLSTPGVELSVRAPPRSPRIPLKHFCEFPQINGHEGGIDGHE